MSSRPRLHLPFSHECPWAINLSLSICVHHICCNNFCTVAWTSRRPTRAWYQPCHQNCLGHDTSSPAEHVQGHVLPPLLFLLFYPMSTWSRNDCIHINVSIYLSSGAKYKRSIVNCKTNKFLTHLLFLKRRKWEHHLYITLREKDCGWWRFIYNKMHFPLLHHLLINISIIMIFQKWRHFKGGKEMEYSSFL